MLNKIMYWAFEGNEGTGKTVLSKSFAEQCGSTWTYEPNAETEELRFLRELSLNNEKKVPSKTRELCLLANRSIHHQNLIIPLLNESASIITDRSFLSGMVYAKIASYSFEEWFTLNQAVGCVFKYPDVIIYCTSNKRKMNKKKIGRENDIYDNADQETIELIDTIYEEALDFISKYKHTKHIPIIRFENNFNLSAEENLKRFIKETKDILLSEEV